MMLQSIHTQRKKRCILTLCVTIAGMFTFFPSISEARVSEDRANDSSLNHDPSLKEGDIVIQGEVTRVQGEFVGKNFSQMNDQRYVVETPLGGKWDLYLGKNTQIIGDIFLGDQVQARINRNGSLQVVEKLEADVSPEEQMVTQRLSGIIERKDADFLFVKQSEDIEHLDSNNLQVEHNLREARQTPHSVREEAGYAVPLQVRKK